MHQTIEPITIPTPPVRLRAHLTGRLAELAVVMPVITGAAASARVALSMVLAELPADDPYEFDAAFRVVMAESGLGALLASLGEIEAVAYEAGEPAPLPALVTS